MKRIAILVLLAIAGQLSAFGQGALTPPGPPGPMFKTVDQVELRTPVTNLPYTISVAGSYYLATNLMGGANTTGVVVQADNVSVDLNGFAIIGAGGSVGPGIFVSGSRANLSVRNGAVRDWGNDGVSAVSAVNAQFERLVISGNSSNGLVCGLNSQIVQCAARLNGRDGIRCVQGSLVKNCLAISNSLNGVSVVNLAGQGSPGTIVTACVLNNNGGAGLSAGFNSLVTENECAGNLIGINMTSSRGRFERNNLIDNGFGLSLGLGSRSNVVVCNSASGNVTNYNFGGTDHLIGPTNNLVVAGGVITNTNPWANFSQ